MKEAVKNDLEKLGFHITDEQLKIEKWIKEEEQKVDNIGYSQAAFSGTPQTYKNIVEGLQELNKHLNNAYHEIQAILNEAP